MIVRLVAGADVRGAAGRGTAEGSVFGGSTAVAPGRAAAGAPVDRPVSGVQDAPSDDEYGAGKDAVPGGVVR